jgi:hypothetical protein
MNFDFIEYHLNPMKNNIYYMPKIIDCVNNHNQIFY